MNISRRDLMLGSTGVACAAALGAVLPTFAQSSPSMKRADPDSIYGFGVRKDAHTLTEFSDDVVMYREAVAHMRKLSEANIFDPLGWAQHWIHHSMFCATSDFDRQIHYGWYFLPWHRAYLANLEQKIRVQLNEPSFALPYWDWTRNPTIPAWYFGTDNALSNSTRYQSPTDEIPADFVEVGPAIRARNWKQFLGLPRRKGDLQVEGTLEQSVHNCVHNWIGGNMASFDGAGDDLLFQSHHGQVDRLWESWLAGEGHVNPTDQAWLDHRFGFFGSDGLPTAIRIGDLLDTRALGYAFDRTDFRHTLTPQNRPRFQGGGRELATIIADEKLLANIEQVRAGRGTKRVSVTYDRISLPTHPYHHRLFFVEDGGAVGDLNAHYVGTHNILPVPDLERGLEGRVTSQVEIDLDALDAFAATGRVRVVGVGVPLKGRKTDTDAVPFQNVRLVFDD